MGQVIVVGILSGLIYSLFAVGIVLVYRGSGAINFAQGEIGTLALYVAWWITTDREMPWLLGAVAAVAFAALCGVAFERLIVRHMIAATRIAVAVATVGLLSFLLAVELKAFSASPRELDGPVGGLGIELAGVRVSPTQILTLVVVAALAGGLAMFLKRTDFGLGVLAAAQDPDAVRLVGVPLSRVSAFVWGTGAAVSALAALLITPTVGVFTPGYATELFVKGLAAAVVGGLVSLPGAFLGGLVVGLLESSATKVITTTSIPNIGLLSVVTLILVVLLLAPRGLAGLAASRLPFLRSAS